MGHQAHGAFLKTVRETDRALAEALHIPNAPVRPFTVSMLRGTPPARDGRLHLSPDETYWLRFTTLFGPLYERFMARFLQAGGQPIIRLGSAQLLIKEICSTRQGHPWAGHTTWSRLVRGAAPSDEIRLAFVSPTAFGFGQKAWGKKVMVLPRPETVFGSLARSWNHLAPEPFQIDRRDLREYLDENVVIKRIDDLHTQMLHLGRSLQIGFVGRVLYGLMSDDEAKRSQLNALANVAFYTGVGMKTTMGMGQCRRMGGAARL
jgi:CRISPR-associated endoribonuclease Cas6